MTGRTELQDAIEALGAHVHVRSGGAAVTLCARACLAELSAVRSLCSFCSVALTGTSMEEDRQFLSPGQIRDLRDDAGMEGRQLKAMREEAEAALKSVPSAFLGPERVLLEELGADETSLTENSREHEARRLETLAQGLVIVIRDVVETTTTTLAPITVPEATSDLPGSGSSKSGMLYTGLIGLSGAALVGTVKPRKKVAKA